MTASSLRRRLSYFVLHLPRLHGMSYVTISTDRIHALTRFIQYIGIPVIFIAYLRAHIDMCLQLFLCSLKYCLVYYREV